MFGKKNLFLVVIMILLIILCGFLIFSTKDKLIEIQGKTKNKILLIGVDGATFDIIDPLIKQGKLSNLQFLMENGTHGDLISIPPNSPSGWGSIATGLKASNHGINDYSIVLGNYTKEWVSFLKKKPVWNILSENGKSVGVMYYLFVWPLNNVNGFIIPSWLYDREDTYPKDLFLQLKPLTIPESEEIKLYKDLYNININLQEKNPNFFDYLIKDYYTSDINYMISFSVLKKKYDPDLFAIVFNDVDTHSHIFWQFSEPQFFDVKKEYAVKYGSVLEKVYERIDTIIGKILEKYDENTIVIIVSDHGMGSDDSRSGIIFKEFKNRLEEGERYVTFRVNVFLKLNGFLNFIEIQNPEINKVDHAEKIDFSKTKVFFCNYIESNTKGLCINLKSRYENGIVEAIEYDSLKSNLIKKLNETRFIDVDINTDPKNIPIDNLGLLKVPVFINIHENLNRTNKYSPDILFELNPVFNYIELNEEWGEHFINPYIVDPNGKKYRYLVSNNQLFELNDFVDFYIPGNHEPNGIFIIKGPHIKNNFVIKNISVEDVAPTILYLAGLNVPSYMDGKVITDAIKKEYIESNPIKITNVSSEEEINQIINISETNKAQIIEKLRSLGYAV